jgi:hypothetical protein
MSAQVKQEILALGPSGAGGHGCLSISVRAVETGMNHLATDLEAGYRMGKADRLVAQQYSWTNMVRCYLEMFQGVSKC